MADASGTNTYSYDLRDRLTQKVTPEGTLTYTYDTAGNLTSVQSSNAGGTSVSYGYDQLNRLSTVTDTHTGNISYTYDNVGNLQAYLYPNGVQTTYSYNTLNRLTNLAVNNSKAQTLASYAYTLGPTGNRTAVSELSGRQVSHTYDALYRLTNETITGDPNKNDGTIGYQYDAVGNRLQRTSTVGPVPPASYTYDANDRLTSDSYDLNGSTTASGGNTYTYDYENHLTSSNAGGVTVVHDGDGNRVAKTASGVTTQYLVDDRNLTGYAQVMEEPTAGVVQRVYTYGLNRISQSQASGTSFYGYDGQGSVRILTDTTGAVTDRYDYDAFGTLVASSGITTNAYLYAGEPRDGDLSLYYLRERWLTEQKGRFVSSDPLEHSPVIPESINRYAYAFNRPTDLNDPSGLWPSAPGHNIHAELLQSAFQSILSAQDINVLVEVSNEQDSPIHGGQDTSRSFEHAMSAGRYAAGACVEQQGVPAAEALYNQFLHSNLQQAQLYEAIGTQATHETALRYLGKNLHAIADSTSPSHRGFQP